MFNRIRLLKYRCRGSYPSEHVAILLDDTQEYSGLALDNDCKIFSKIVFVQTFWDVKSTDISSSTTVDYVRATTITY